MSDLDQRVSRSVLAARILLILDLVFCLIVGAFGVRNVLAPPTTACGRPPASIHDAIVVIAALVPVLGLGAWLLGKPMRIGWQTALATIAMIGLTLLAVAPPALYTFQNGFCLSPF